MDNPQPSPQPRRASFEAVLRRGCSSQTKWQWVDRRAPDAGSRAAGLRYSRSHRETGDLERNAGAFGSRLWRVASQESSG